MTEERLINIINTIYDTEGFQGVIEEVRDRLKYGTVSKRNGLYCIATGGWSEDEMLVEALISLLSKFHHHYVGYLRGGAFYFLEVKSFECMRRVEIILRDEEDD